MWCSLMDSEENISYRQTECLPTANSTGHIDSAAQATTPDQRAAAQT